MKDRAVLLTTLILVLTVTLFLWVTWVRWGTMGIHPALGRLVLGVAFFACAASGLFLISRRRAGRLRTSRRSVAPPAPVDAKADPARASAEEAEKIQVAVE